MVQEESLITDEMRSSIGREEAPITYEVERLGIRQFALAVGYSDPVYFDEAHAMSKGYRSLLAPPTYLGSPVQAAGMSVPPSASSPPWAGPRWRRLNGGSEYEYADVPICAGDVLTSVSKIIDIRERKGSLGSMLIIQRESTFTNQEGDVVCRTVGTGILY